MFRKGTKSLVHTKMISVQSHSRETLQSFTASRRRRDTDYRSNTQRLQFKYGAINLIYIQMNRIQQL